MLTVHDIFSGVATSFWCAVAWSLVVLVKSLADFSRTGPQLREEILKSYLSYTAYSVFRLVIWAALITTALAWSGYLVYVSLVVLFTDSAPVLGLEIAACVIAIGTYTSLNFCSQLLHIPSAILASWQYRFSRLYPLWHRLSPQRIRNAELITYTIAILIPAIAVIKLLSERSVTEAVLLVVLSAPIIFVLVANARHSAEPLPLGSVTPDSSAPPNIVMIGCDTLRADRIGEDYERKLSPNINRLIERGYQFRSCYIPLGRTAPSLASILTGAWPRTHGVRDNYVSDYEASIATEALPKTLRRNAYRNIAVTDWAGADLKKLDFGYDTVDGPDDQWNIKYYIRQGPMFLRLFLSLFTHNWFGKKFLPELYYLASVPLNTELGRRARALISREAKNGKPFHLNVFMSTAHVPFGSDYPYYTMYTDKNYDGVSKFVMTTLRDPNEIISHQEAPEETFDLQQIVNLYDGCIRRFDDEVGRIVQHLDDCNILHNTIFVIYSDHGLDLFENGTWGQGNTVVGNDVGARVPLVIVDPRRKGGVAVDQIVRSIDIAPTLLDLAGIDRAPSCDGVSLKPLMDDPGLDLELDAYQETGMWIARVRGMHPEHIVYPNLLELLEVPDKNTGTLSIRPEFSPLIMGAKDRMLRSGPWKLVMLALESGPAYLLYDTRNDPTCESDVAAQHPETLEELKRKLHALIGEEAPLLRDTRSPVLDGACT